MVKRKGLTDEEKKEIIEDLDDDDEAVYRENLKDYENWNKSKRDSIISKFNQRECDAQIEFFKNKIEMVIRLKEKIRNMG